MLREGGSFCAKFFKMDDLSYLHAMMKQLFRDVYVVKPESSRMSSAESFVVGLGFDPQGKLVVSKSLSVIAQPITNPESTESDDDQLTF